MVLLGRTKEKEKLESFYQEDKPHFLAVYGRRRVGKTYLIRTYFKDRFFLHHTGMAEVSMTSQLQNFQESLQEQTGGPKKELTTWLEAFNALKTAISKSRKKRKVIFIDEMPWMDTPKSEFLPALENFWNGWASSRSDLFLIVCGSATSWIVKNIFNNTGGLHNRVTARMKIQPFTLGETKAFLTYKNIAWDHYSIIKAYMALGGIPYYLEMITKGKSVDQSIDELFYAKDGELRNEYTNLYHSLFRNAENYMAVIAALSTKKKGMTREEVLKKTKLSSGGYFTRLLEELELSDFIRSYIPLGRKSRDKIYQLTDFYSLFYFHFLADKNTKAGDWLAALDHPSHRAWSGYAFEQVCMAHIAEIKRALGIEAVQTQESAWRSRASEDGAQVDLVLQRRDNIIHLFEMKFSINEYTITKKYDAELRNKLGSFRQETKTKSAVWLAMLTTYGIKDGPYKYQIQNELTMDCLFD